MLQASLSNKALISVITCVCVLFFMFFTFDIGSMGPADQKPGKISLLSDIGGARLFAFHGKIRLRPETKRYVNRYNPDISSRKYKPIKIDALNNGIGKKKYI